MAAEGKILKCPICGKPTTLDAKPVGMFCSERCKLVDLGRWLGEDYKMSEPLRPDHFTGEIDLDADNR